MDDDLAKREYESQDALYKHGMDLYGSKNNKDLERLFAKHLKKSYDLRFWNLYIEYVKRVSVKKVNIADVYAFVLSHFEYSYSTVDLVKEYIAELSNVDDEALKTEKIRKVYQKAFTCPMQGLSQLWCDYEKWELSVNKGTARGFIDQTQPVYNHTHSVYQRLLPHIQAEDYFRAFDIELENPLKHTKAVHTARLAFVLNFYISKFPNAEALYFLQTFYLKETARTERPRTLFLSIWYSFLYKKNLFDFDDKDRFDLVCINYFNWIIKNDGIEAFRSKFSEVKEQVGAQVYIYAANAEYYQGGSKERAYQVFQEVFTKCPDDPLVCEEFFRLFVKTGDDDNIRSLFKKLGKTERMWEMMIEYEFLHGDIEQYKGFLLMQQEAVRRREVLPAAPVVLKRAKADGTRGLYETVRESFGYLSLQLTSTNVMQSFLEKLPKLDGAENIFCNLNAATLIELLLSI